MQLFAKRLVDPVKLLAPMGPPGDLCLGERVDPVVSEGRLGLFQAQEMSELLAGAAEMTHFVSNGHHNGGIDLAEHGVEPAM